MFVYVEMCKVVYMYQYLVVYGEDEEEVEEDVALEEDVV